MPLSQNIVATYSMKTSSLLLRMKPKKRGNEKKGTCNASSLRTKITMLKAGKLSVLKAEG
jgi:hypothetical protein